MINPAVIANAFLYIAAQEQIPITPQKLQQLVYCYYRETLRVTGKKLFQEPFVKGNNGPLLLSMDYKFGCFENEPITKLWRDASGNADMLDIRATGFLSVKQFHKVWSCYKKASVYKIEKILTEPGSAWDRAEENILRDKDISLERTKTVLSSKKEITL